MARLRKSRSNYDISLIPSDATDRPLGLMLQRPTKNGRQGPATIGVDYLPAHAFDEKSWFWQNGPAGAGWSIGTPESEAAGGLSHGENVWLRKSGSATAAGKITEIVMPPPLSTATGGRIFDCFEWGANQDMWFTTGTQYLLLIPAGYSTPQIGWNFGAPTHVSKNCAIFDGSGAARAYVSFAGSNSIQEFDGATFLAAEAAVTRGRLATVYWVLGNGIASGGSLGQGGTGGYRMIGTDAVNAGFYHVAGDPKVAANWSDFIPVGDSNFSIQNIVASNRTVWFGKTNGVHAVDELGYAPNVSKWFELAFDGNNCGSVAYWEGAIWVAHGQGLVMIPTNGERQDVASFVQFGYQKSNLSPVWGRPRWVAPSPDGLYVGYYNDVTDTSYIGVLMLQGGRYRWSMAEAVVPGEVTFIRHATPGTGPRLWIGTLDADDLMHLYYQELPKTGDPELDIATATGFHAAADWSVTCSKFNGGTSDEKTFRRYTLESEGVGDANTVQWLVSADGGAFTEQGVATESPTWSGTPTTDYMRGVSAQVKLVVHNAETEPVVLRSAEVKYTPHPRLTKVKVYPVVFGENVPLKNGRPDRRDPGVTLTRLENLQTDDPMDMVDELGRTVEVLVDSFQETETEEADGNGYRVEGTLRVSITRSPAQFDIDSFDTGAFFS